jgi:hypothetical protein
MDSLTELLKDFAGALASATDAPDGYPEWGYVTYESNMRDLKQLWAEIRPKLKRDVERVEDINGMLQEMFDAFESGDRDRGRASVWALYNSDVKRLR